MTTRKMTVLSIDPGSNYTGFTVMDLYADGTMVVLFVETVDATSLIKQFQDVESIHGTRYAKIYAIGVRLKQLLEIHKPQLVVSEAPFYNPTRPQAFGALVEVLSMFRTIIFNHDPSLPFETIDPSTVKNSLQVKGTSGDKTLMMNGLLKQDLKYVGNLNVAELDEHSIDSVAVGFTACTQLDNML